VGNIQFQASLYAAGAICLAGRGRRKNTSKKKALDEASRAVLKSIVRDFFPPRRRLRLRLSFFSTSIVSFSCVSSYLVGNSKKILLRLSCPRKLQ
jgi:hypothetical protein